MTPKKTLMALIATLAFALPASAPASAKNYLFLVDQTEVYDEVDLRRFMEGAAHVFNELEGRDFLAIYAISDSPGSLKPVFKGVVPGCTAAEAREESLFDRHCSGILTKNKIAAFKDGYVNVARQLGLNEQRLSSRKVERSEIIRSLAAVLNEYGDTKPDKLILFSDLIEYSTIANMYSFGAPQVASALKRAKRENDLAGALANTEVKIYGFGRRIGGDYLTRKLSPDYVRKKFGPSGLKLDPHTRTAIHAFWEDYLVTSGRAQSLSITQDYNAGPIQ